MASLKAKRNVWYAQFYINGEQKRKSTGFEVTPKDGTKPSLSRKRAEQAAEIIEKKEKGELSGNAAALAFRALADMMDDAPALTVREYLEAYRPAGKESNQKGALRAIGLFLAFLAERHLDSTPLDKLKRKPCEEFLGKMIQEVSAGSVGIYRAHLVAAFNRAVKDELLTSNPFAKVAVNAVVLQYAPETHGQDENERDTFTPEELRTILFDFPQPWQDLAAVGLWTGQRIGDCSTLTWGQVDFERGTVHFKTGKTKAKLDIPMSADLARRLQAIKAASHDPAHVFPSLARLYERSRSTLSTQFTALLRAHGILTDAPQVKKGRRRNMASKCFHSLRHSVVTVARAAGIPADVCRDFVGHESEIVERGYFKADMDAKRAVPDALAAFLSRPTDTPTP